MKVLLLNGPNLNMLGKREPEYYGSLTLQQIEQNIIQEAKTLNIDIECFQTNREYELIEKIHSAFGVVDFIIINPAALTHTSVALRDALLSVAIPFVEVHLSNIHSRESFRHHSYLSDKAVGVICGLGAQGYDVALRFAVDYLQQNR